MKKLIAVLLALSCASISFANDGIAHSSWTATNEAGSLIRMNTSTNTIAHVLTAVVVSTPSPVGTLTIFNSTFTVNSSTVAIIGLGTVGTYNFYDVQVKGITYTITGNTQGVSIIYKQ